jgi:hypothetical protein
MALSPNYQWAEPDNSSLVKNGAQDIRALGDAIDTSVWNVGYGQAGKNKIINGDFAVNQRAFTSTTTSDTYGFDRWFAPLNDGTCTYSAQTFTPGAAPVAGYEAANFARIQTTGQTLTTARAAFNQKIENVRTFAGQTVTVSFWAKAATGTPNVSTEFAQNFGTGGSPSASVTAIGVNKIAITTSWVRYSVSVSIPSISGKTLGTTVNTGHLQFALYVSAGSFYDARTNNLGIQSNTFDIWGVQVEYGSTATPFQTATGTIQGELAACQRYYYRITPSAIGNRLASAACDSITLSESVIQFPVTLRTAPTALEQSGTAADYTLRVAGSTITCSSVPTFLNATPFTVGTNFAVAAGLVAGQAANIRAAATTAFLGWSAEL